MTKFVPEIPLTVDTISSGVGDRQSRLPGQPHPLLGACDVASSAQAPSPGVVALGAGDAVAVGVFFVFFALLIAGEAQHAGKVVAHLPFAAARHDAQPKLDHLRHDTLDWRQLLDRDPCAVVVALLSELLG